MAASGMVDGRARRALKEGSSALTRRNGSRSLLVAGIGLGALTLLSGCVAVVAAGGVAGGYTIAQERGLEATAIDAGIKSQITKAWDRYNFDMSRNLDLTIYEGRVLISGRIPNADWRDEAVKRAWAVPGVKEVYNEIEIGPLQVTEEEVADTWISTQLRNDLIWDADVRSVNYLVTVTDHVVFLMGSARSQAELDRVVGYARIVPGVKRVVSYIRIRTGAPPESQPQASGSPQQSAPPSATSAPPPPASAPPPPASAPAPAGSGDRIEVQPLQ